MTTSIARGMQLVKYYELELQVPSDWSISRSVEIACPTHANKIVYIDYRDSGADCMAEINSKNLTLFLDAPTAPFDALQSQILDSIKKANS